MKQYTFKQKHHFKKTIILEGIFLKAAPRVGKPYSHTLQVEVEIVTNSLEYSLASSQSFRILHPFGPSVFTPGKDCQSNTYKHVQGDRFKNIYCSIIYDI